MALESAGPNRTAGVGWRALLTILALAFAARAVFLLVGNDAGLFDGLFLDGRWYAERAASIHAGDGAGDGPYLLSPLYPYLLAPFVGESGLDAASVRWIQAVAGSFSAVLSALLAARLAGRTAGVIAGLAVALYGPSLHYDAQVLTSAFQTLFLTLAVVLATLEPFKKAAANWVSAGLAAGIAAALHPTSLAVAAGLVIALLVRAWMQRREGFDRRAIAARVAGLVLGAAVVVTPFTIRNWRVSGEPVLLSANGGMNFWVGNHAGADGLFHPPEGYDFRNDPVGRGIAARALLHNPTWSEASSWWENRAWNDIRAAPRSWLALLGRKALLFAHSGEVPQLGEGFAWFSERAWPLRFPLDGRLVLLLALVAPFAMALRGKRSWKLAFPLGALCAYAAGIVVFFVTGRHRAPIMPVAIAIAAAGAVEVARLVTMGTWRRPVATLLLLGLSVTVFGASQWFYSGPFAVPRETGVEERHRGMALAAQGRFAEAVTAYERGIEIDDDVATRTNLANALRALGRIDDAQAQYRIVLDRDPQHAIAWYGLGNLLRQQKRDFRGALAAYQRAIASQPNFPEAHYNLGAVLLDLNRPDDAVAEIEAALSLAPPNATWREAAELALAGARVRANEAREPVTPR